ncbi:hypothetical protein [Streptomyces aurantiogriseus]|uniref:Uncharacterized protein n=1 Tax=Streptomyces aurantiogriseus TaxID=66870 RepID=A0A918F881_9ACTN|nr:hypothetical protein [Streptomyces aurantiogriseus]GGR18135.1 hypothetical protein GCM10010251_37780 [Streptomyces aurantiogriseus]
MSGGTGAAESAADSCATENLALVLAAAQRVHELEDSAAERDYDQQRVALWLALTGLCAVLLIGRVLDHRETILLGALGGFLSPVVGVMRSQRPSSWGVLVLAPVGGALAAVGGLLLVRMLADPDLNLLGQVFLENSWGARAPSRRPSPCCSDSPASCSPAWPLPPPAS